MEENGSIHDLVSDEYIMKMISLIFVSDSEI